jgi:peptidoglycan/xylan/chitin deacetylase (PgdA/CDA1 family)
MTAAQQEERVSSANSIGDATGEREQVLPDGTGSQDTDTAIVEKKKVALTFDDGPDSEYTPMLLDGLAERNVKATFFVIGKQAEAQPQIMERMVKEGHLIGNHTYNHVDIRHMTESAAEKEIIKANEVIEKYTGEEPCFLRPPFGSSSSKMEKKMEMISVLWTIDTMDWACQNESKICSTVYREIKENSIILMHDEYPTSVRAALSVVDRLQKEGYEFVTVDKIVMD